MSTTYIFYITGMHCKSCELITESELQDIPYITHVKANLNSHTVKITGDFGSRSEAEIMGQLSQVLSKHGYSLSANKQTLNNQWSDFKIAVPLALGFILLFLALQKIGLVNLVNTSSVNYGTAFVIGVIASLSTCMAVVGGLLLSMSATFAREGAKFKSQILFHGGRLAAFFLLGGVIGAIGSAFTLSTSASFVLSLAVGLIMLILGINLLEVFHWSKKLQPTMPKFLSKHALGVSKFNHTLTPLLLGVVTFFLPCGFTQSMQIYTLTTGSFLPGGLTMLFFALGTLPVLSFISFSSFTITNSSKSGIFFKTAGLVVVMLALFNLINSLAVMGIIRPIFSF